MRELAHPFRREQRTSPRAEEGPLTGGLMPDKSEDDQQDSNPSAGVTRREVVTRTIAAVGLAAASRGSAVDAAPTPTGEGKLPLTDRGYFTSNGEVFIPKGQGFDATNANFFEVPLEDPDYLEVWSYTDKISYLPGEEVEFHTSTTGKTFSIEVVRDGFKPKTVYLVENLPGRMHKLPAGFYEKGCGWPISHRWKLPGDLVPGFYVVISRTSSERSALNQQPFGSAPTKEVREQEHGFFVRRPKNGPKADILLIASTSTWTAYNDWGGFSHYVGYNLPDNFTHAPRLTLHRPFARGIIWSPEGAPRKPHELSMPPNAIPRYPVIEFAYTRGYSKWFTNCGWATYERHFVAFAEREGFELDYGTRSICTMIRIGSMVTRPWSLLAIVNIGRGRCARPLIDM